MRSRWRISGMLLVTLMVVFLTGTTFQQAAAREQAELMGVLVEPVPVASFSNEAPVAQQAQNPQWSNWSTLEGYTTSAPSVAAAGRNNVFLFARSERGTLAWSRWNGSNWSRLTELRSERLASAPSCASWGSNNAIRISCFAVLEGSNSLRHLYYADGNWYGWQNLGGVATSAPGAVSWDFGVVSAFVRGQGDGQMYQIWYSQRTGWSGWTPLGGRLTSAPACTSLREPPLRVDCVVRGDGNNLYLKTWQEGSGRGWQADWTNLGGGVASAPTIATWGVNRLSAFYRGENGNMTQRYWDGNQWVGPIDLGGQITSSPSCISPERNRIECYAQGVDALYNAGPPIIQRVWSGQ
jgi:hypothetical protein